MRQGEILVDYYVPVASAPRYEWLKPENIKPHQDGYLTAEPARKKEFQERLDAISNKPKVGLAWRSGIIATERAFLYASIEALAPLMALGDKVDFINLQYGDVDAELATFKERYGVTVHNFDDVDLKQDIEANLAIASCCDIVTSSCSAPGMFSMSVGTPTLLMSGGKPWWSFGHETKVPFAANGELFNCTDEKGWDRVIEEIAQATRELTKV